MKLERNINYSYNKNTLKWTTEWIADKTFQAYFNSYLKIYQWHERFKVRLWLEEALTIDLPIRSEEALEYRPSWQKKYGKFE